MTRVGFTEEIREEIEIFLEFNENEKKPHRHKKLLIKYLQTQFNNTL